MKNYILNKKSLYQIYKKKIKSMTLSKYENFKKYF